MSLLDSISQWIDKDGTQLAYVRIPASQVDNPSTPQTLQAGVHYIRLRLASMFLKKSTKWFSTWYPVVQSTVRFQFADQLIEIPNIADESRLTMQQTPGGDVIARNFVLTPQMPFHGGVVSLAAGLFALEGQNYLKSVLKTFGKFSSLLSVPQLSLALNVAEPLAVGIQELFTTANAGMHLGLHDSFSAGELQDGYFAAIRLPSDAVKVTELFVVNNELHEGSNPKNTQPFVKADYMLFRAELLDKRDDWEGLKSIKEPFDDAINSLGGDQSQATHYMRTALLRATRSPDLTAVDKRRVVDRLIEKYGEAKALSGFSGVTQGEAQTLDQIMRNPMKTKLALAKGAPLESEVFAAIREETRPNQEETVAKDIGREILAKDKFRQARRNMSFNIARDAAPDDKKEKPSFYFATTGNGVRGNRVKFGAEFDLIFNYGVEEAARLAILTGGKLKNLLLTESAELDIVIIPRGFTLKDSKWVKRATFVKGVMLEKIVFHLKAATEAVEDAGINVIFETRGAVLYEFFIPFQLTATLEENGDTDFEPLNFDLDDLTAVRERQQRTARILIFANGDKLDISFDNLETDESFPVETNLVTRSSLGDLLGAAKEYLEPVPNHIIWGVLDEPLAKPDNNKSAELAFKECLERVATAGWELYKGLSNDPEFAKVLEAVEKLESGSTVSIKTNCAFLPWEILNRSPFNWKDPDEIKAERPVQPQNFWGNRFLIECLLAGEKHSYKTPSAMHQSSPAYVSMNVFRTIDQEVGGNFLPGKSHETLCTELEPDAKAELRRDGKEIRKVFFENNYGPTLIYFLCHGQNDKPLNPSQREKLEIDVKDFVAPNDVYVDSKYPSGPIIFLNSCSSGAASPLAFSTFLSEFRKKNALGLIGTSFPVPITFGSAFGQELVRQYVKKHKPIGQALLDLRRQQLANGNPIGLFYTLQCPVDITSHHK
jgi:hypothetical protein